MTAALYILANKRCGTLYAGVTSHLVQRVYRHKNGLTKGFAEKYHCDRLVYFELYEGIAEAIAREKQIKAGSRAKKIALIESINPEWSDLYPTLL
jgi:putative endonuclease